MSVMVLPRPMSSARQPPRPSDGHPVPASAGPQLVVAQRGGEARRGGDGAGWARVGQLGAQAVEPRGGFDVELLAAEARDAGERSRDGVQGGHRVRLRPARRPRAIAGSARTHRPRSRTTALGLPATPPAAPPAWTAARRSRSSAVSRTPSSMSSWVSVMGADDVVAADDMDDDKDSAANAPSPRPGSTGRPSPPGTSSGVKTATDRTCWRSSGGHSTVMPTAVSAAAPCASSSWTSAAARRSSEGTGWSRRPSSGGHAEAPARRRARISVIARCRRG